MDGELEFTAKLLNLDVRNNSAWNHRIFVLKNSNMGNGPSQEIEFALSKLQIVSNNEAAWVYLKGVLELLPNPESHLQSIKTFMESLADIPIQAALLFVCYPDHFKDLGHRLHKVSLTVVLYLCQFISQPYASNDHYRREILKQGFSDLLQTVVKRQPSTFKSLN